MRLLLDTHIFLWYTTGDSRLPAAVLPLIRDPANTVYLSVISVWEVLVKHQLGKLPLPQPPEIYIPQQRQRHQIESLPLDEESVTKLAQERVLHKEGGWGWDKRVDEAGVHYTFGTTIGGEGGV